MKKKRCNQLKETIEMIFLIVMIVQLILEVIKGIITLI
jgi:hypothetical protein